MTSPQIASVRSLLRAEMPVADEYAYFDHAAVAPLPRSSAEALTAYARQASLTGDLSWLEWSAAVRETRRFAASLIGASTREIALVNSTTQGIGIIAEGFPWKAGDNLVVPANEFPSNLVPWRNLASRGVEVRCVPVPDSGAVTADLLERWLDSRTRIVSLSWVGFVSGFRADVRQIADLAHANGSYLFLDAIQGLGAFPLSVVDSQVDFLAADGHKWMLGPEGAGLLYVREELLERLRPVGIGWNSLASSGFDPNSIELKNDASRYEGGTTNMPGMLAFGASLKLLCDLQQTCHTNENHTDSLAGAILENVDAIAGAVEQLGLEAHYPDSLDQRSGIISISLPGADEVTYQQARGHCAKQGIALSVRGGRLRLGTHAYNNAGDIEKLVTALDSFLNG